MLIKANQVNSPALQGVQGSANGSGTSGRPTGILLGKFQTTNMLHGLSTSSESDCISDAFVSCSFTDSVLMFLDLLPWLRNWE